MAEDRQSLEDRVRAQMKARSRFIIDPRTSQRIGYWDALTSLALVYTSLVTPAEVALCEAAVSPLEPMFLINRVIDGIFSLDILVQFSLMIEKTSKDSGRGTVWLTKRSMIAHEYLRSWFFLDIFSVLVSVFDMIGLEAMQPVILALAGGGGGGARLGTRLLRRHLRLRGRLLLQI